VAIVGSGTQFQTLGVSSIDFGSGITVGSFTITDDTHLTAYNVAISSTAAAGLRTVTVTYSNNTTVTGNIFGVVSPDWVIQKSENTSGPGSPDTYDIMYDIQFVSEKVGFAVRNYDKFWKTTDRGVTWTESNIPSPASFTPYTAYPKFPPFAHTPIPLVTTLSNDPPAVVPLALTPITSLYLTFLAVIAKGTETRRWRGVISAVSPETCTPR
jgi:hypothetical protein